MKRNLITLPYLRLEYLSTIPGMFGAGFFVHAYPFCLNLYFGPLDLRIGERKAFEEEL